MGIKQVTPDSVIRKAIEDDIALKRSLIIEKLCVAGEQAVNEARTSHTYQDQTGNLTSSIGYAVFVDGEAVQIGDFNPVPATEGDGSLGTVTGREFAESLAMQLNRGIVLVVVAGMKYAKYVAAKGYNVLDSSYTLAKDLVPALLKELMEDIES